MNSNIDLKDLWQKQTGKQPGIDELFVKLKQFKKSNVRTLIKMNILLLGTTVFILIIWYYAQPKLITTKIGIVLVIAAMAVFLFPNNQLFSLFKKMDNALSNSAYLQHLIILKNKQLFVQTTMINLYFVLMSAGICLYWYEYTAQMPVFWAIFVYVMTLGWITFTWLYLKPKTVKKQQLQINELIERFREVAGQLDEVV
jgi:hypothetical protein